MAANIYNNLSAAKNNSPSCCPPDPPDDISLFLQQIIFRSSPPPSSSSSSITARHQPFAALSNLGHGVFSTPGQISAPEPPPALMNSSSGFGPPAATANVSSSSAGRLDSEADEYDYDSEDVVEAAVEEAAARPTPRRSSSKRSRAAEVHNQSEKRRRRKINEKMKALQNLIPNSNKTDKASMLDEAIEYLKQLQLQVQTLTMRNGLSLYPNCAPGIQHMYQMKMDPDFDFETAHANPTGSVPMDHQNIADHLIRLEDKCDNNKQAPVMDFSCTIASKPSFKVESKSSTMLDHFGTYHRTRSSKKPANEVFPRTSSTGTSATSSILCGTNMSDLKESTIETCLVGGDHLLQNFVNHPIFSSHLNM